MTMEVKAREDVMRESMPRSRKDEMKVMIQSRETSEGWPIGGLKQIVRAS